MSESFAIDQSSWDGKGEPVAIAKALGIGRARVYQVLSFRMQRDSAPIAGSRLRVADEILKAGKTTKRARPLLAV